MTTSKQIKNLVKNTTFGLPDVRHLQRDVLWLTPIAHVARKIAIKRCLNSHFFDLACFMADLYLPYSKPTQGYGRNYITYYRSKYEPNVGNYRLWEWADPDLEASFVNCLESDILPELRALDSVGSFIAYIRSSEDRLIYHGWKWHMVTSIALGDFEAARAHWTPHAEFYVPGKVVDDYAQREYDRLCELGAPLMADDRAALAALLHRWEAENVRGTAIEPYWQPSPFPFEEADVPDVAPGPRPAG